MEEQKEHILNMLDETARKVRNIKNEADKHSAINYIKDIERQL